MPWQSEKASDTTCTKYSELEILLNELDAISDMNDQKFQDEIGCLAPCTRKEYWTKKVYQVEEGTYGPTLEDLLAVKKKLTSKDHGHFFVVTL